ncbi:MAG: hypothetical protein ACREQF_04900 [Candidatus Binataceae bacterium]
MTEGRRESDGRIILVDVMVGRSAARNARVVAIAVALLCIGAATVDAQIKTLGRLRIPAGAKVLAVCTDMVMQRELNARLRSMGLAPKFEAGEKTVTLTVTLHDNVMSPAASLNQIAPGDPAIAGMIESLGVQAPPLGDSGDDRPDPYAIAAHRRATTPSDPLSETYRELLAERQAVDKTAGATGYERLPKEQVYDTVIVARATLSSTTEEFKLVALVHPGDDVRGAHEQVAREIAAAISR